MSADRLRPKALIFDWDNTLIDSWATIGEALNETFVAFGLPEWSADEIRRRVRQSARDAFPVLFGARWQDAQKHYLSTFERLHLTALSPLPHAKELVEWLADEGLYLAVVSNKTGRLLRTEARHLGWDSQFAAIVGAGDAFRDKPDPAPVRLALAPLGPDHLPNGDQVWFVGDTGIDMQCAYNCGIQKVLVGPGDGLEGSEAPDLHFSDCRALHQHLMAMPGS